MYEYFRYAVDGFVATATLDRPKVNALSNALLDELEKLVADVDASPEVRVLVITGGPQRFSAGVDITELRVAPASDAVPRNTRYQRIYRRVADCRVPVIAAVEGYALGGGCELTLACDIRVASTGSSFALPEINLGGLPGMGGMQRLARLVGPGAAKRIILTGERIDGTEAHRIGLVDILTDVGEALTQAQVLAERIASRPPLSVQAGKWAVDTGAGAPFDTALGVDLTAVALVAATEDRAECLAAFLEKRPAIVRGR